MEVPGSVVLDGPEGTAVVTDLPDGTRLVSSTPWDPEAYVSRRECTTKYSPELIAMILRVKGARWLCEEIEREENPGYLQHELWWTVRAHLSEQELHGRRVLDFGCGAGPSTMILARLFDQGQTVGVDIDEPALEIAEARRQHYGMANVEFRLSSNPMGLPDGLGQFDVIICSAVLEHLLPDERPVVIPALWASLRPGGIILICETPHRFSPIETHTTGGLPLINYLPPPLAMWAARRFSKRVWPGATWQGLLRAGIRGSSEGEFLRILRHAGARDASVRRPSAHAAVCDEFDLWYEISHVNELPRLKGHLRKVFRALKRATGVSFTPYLAFAVQRPADPSAPHTRPA